MSMDVAEDNHFKIHVAKAKDLAPSWYDLVLRPDLFEQHVRKLKEKPNAEPTAMQLIATFLDKAGCIPITEDMQAPTTPRPSQEKRQVLVDCALMVASAVVQWDLDALEKSLPPAVLLVLLSELREKFVSEQLAKFDVSDYKPFADYTSDVIMAKFLHDQWIMRFMQQSMRFCGPAHRLPVSTVEVACPSPAHIFELVKPHVQESMDGLLSLCDHEADVDDELTLPGVTVTLPSLNSSSHSISPDTVTISKTRLMCETLYTLASQFFFENRFSDAHKHFVRCNKLFNSLSPKDCPPFVNQAELRGSLIACRGLIGEEAEQGEEEVEKGGVADRLEEMRLVDDFEGVGQLLLDDLTNREIPSIIITSLEKEASDWSENLAAMETQAKRPRLSQPIVSLSVPLNDRVCLSNGLRSVLEGKSPQCHFWQLLSKEKQDHLEYVLHVCGQLVKKKLKQTELTHLQNFIRGLCCDVGVGGGKADVWRKFFNSTAGKKILAEDVDVFQDLVSPLPKLASPVEQDQPDVNTEVHKLERRVSQALTSQEVTTAVQMLFQATPTNQHKSIALQWVGSASGFAPVESMPDLLTLTKYNAMVYRAQQLKIAKSYTESVDLFNGALSLLVAKTTPVSAKVRQQLEDHLQEQVLIGQLLSTNQDLVKVGGASIQQRLQSKQLAPLLAKSTSYYMNRSSPDAVTLNMAGAFLLNAQNYSFLAGHSAQYEPGRIAPRLAAAVMNVNESKDARKSIRDLFEAVLGIFSPPLHSGEGKAEVSERQSKLRSSLVSFVENLVDPMSLSLLMAALARIWNLLKKPEYDILSEYSNHWPTAIGNPAGIDANHVFRSLSSTLNHALRLRPSMTSWITMKGDLHCAIGDYGAAIENYLQSGSISSSYFESDVPPQTWTPVVYQRIITSCSKLGYHTHAAIFCQFLQPVDYELAFSILKENVESTVDSLFVHFWDMTIIEYLIYIHSKKGDTHKQATAVQVAGQAELNFNNSSEVLERAASVRKRRFLRAFYSQVTNSV